MPVADCLSKSRVPGCCFCDTSPQTRQVPAICLDRSQRLGQLPSSVPAAFLARTAQPSNSRIGPGIGPHKSEEVAGFATFLYRNLSSHGDPEAVRSTIQATSTMRPPIDHAPGVGIFQVDLIASTRNYHCQRTGRMPLLRPLLPSAGSTCCAKVSAKASPSPGDAWPRFCMSAFDSSTAHCVASTL
jgi:hypothetical protein